VPPVDYEATAEYYPPDPIFAKDDVDDDDLTGMSVLRSHRDDDSSENEADMVKFYEDEHKEVSSGLYIIYTIQDYMTTYLKMLLLTGIALEIASIQGRTRENKPGK
jgi:hypothetical protein